MRLNWMMLAATGLAATSMIGPVRAEDRIRILCPTWSGYAPMFVAQDLGYYKKLGLSVDVRFDEERADVMAAMARGDIEMELRTIDDYQGRPRTEAMPGTIIGTIDESSGGDGVLAGGDIKTVADLKGKTVAADIGAPGRLLLQLELHKVGMTLKDLQMKQISTPDTVSVFADKSLSAVVTYQPFLSQALKIDTARNPHQLVSSKDFPHTIVDIFIVRHDDLVKNPQAYEHFLTATYQAIDYFRTNRDDFMKLAAPHFNLSPADFAVTVDGSLKYTDLALAKSLLGTAAAPGPIYKTFDTLMQLNLENGGADTKLSAAHSIDPAPLSKISLTDVASAK